MSLESILDRIANALETIAKNGGRIISTASSVTSAEPVKRGPGRPPKAAPAEAEAEVDEPTDDDAPADAHTDADEAEAVEAEPEEPAAPKQSAKAAVQAIVEKRVAVKMKFKALIAEKGGRAKAVAILNSLGCDTISGLPDERLDRAMAALKKAAASAAAA